MCRRVVLLLSIVAAVGARTAPAQVVRGAVRDGATGAPVGGAVVWLSDSTGALVARSLSDATGVFAVPRLRGSTVLHVVRIGFRPRDVALAAADSTLDLRLEPLPALLSGVTASSQRVCPGDAGGRGAFELWEQARAALLASVVAREAQPPRIRLISFTRTREPILGRITHLETNTKEVFVERSYVAARPAWAFADEGYMTEGKGGERTYYAPDNETLLDPSFAATHCLQVAKGDRFHPDQIGIAFEPAPVGDRDTLVDVRGVLWLDRARPSLRSLEFRYTGLEPVARESGGEITFGVMPNGASMVQRWIIRTAIVAVDIENRFDGIRQAPPPREVRRNVRKTGVREVGGELAFVQWRDGSSWQGALPRIAGIVTDSAGTPVAGVRVWMAKTGDTVTTNAHGRFVLPPMLAGVYAVLASDSTLAESGLSRTSHYWVMLDDMRGEDIQLLMHPRSVVLDQLCQGQRLGSGTGVVIGRVVGADGEPIANAHLDLWRRQRSGNVEVFHEEPGGAAGEDGRFVICGTPRDQQLRIRASRASERGEIVIDAWKDEVVMATIVVRGT